MSDRKFLKAMRIDPDSAPADSASIAKAMVSRMDEPAVVDYRAAAYRWCDEAREFAIKCDSLSASLDLVRASRRSAQNWLAIAIAGNLVLLIALLALWKSIS